MLGTEIRALQWSTFNFFLQVELLAGFSTGAQQQFQDFSSQSSSIHPFIVYLKPKSGTHSSTMFQRMAIVASSSSSIVGTRLPCLVAKSAGRCTFRTMQPIMMGRRSAKIAVRKGKADAQKAKLYGKLGKMIAQAVRSGGTDPIANARLREVLAQAKLANLPNDIIERNIKKATDKNSADYSEIFYEAYGPGGTGFIIEALTDNVNRTASDVRIAVTKSGGKMADVGSVLFNFQRTGLIMVDAEEGEDKVRLCALMPLVLDETSII